MACDPATEANDIFIALMADEDFQIPSIEVEDVTFPAFPDIDYSAPVALTNEDLTTRQLKGTGTFDALMESFGVHIKSEYEKGRITGAEYAKAWVSLAEGAMATATQYLLGKDQAYWQAVTAQNQAKLAQAQYETAKLGLILVQFQALTAKSEYALNKMRLASAQVEYCVNKFNLDEMLPQQKLMLISQGDLVREQYESQRAQTLDTRTDGDPILGAIGKQKDLSSQQILSYKRDSEIKTGRMYLDSWITQKTMDEGLVAPTQFTNANLDVIFSAIKTNNGL